MRYILLLLVLVLSLSVTAQTRQMVITIDDLPYMSAGHREFLPNAQRTTRAILQALQRHRVTAVGFVNEDKLQAKGEVDARIALLQQWVDAGMILGNHTYSHADFNALTAEQFQDEIIKGEVFTRRLMQSRQPYQLYFRHPMTRTGNTLEKRDAVEAFLNARGYQITPHTIENSDFIFNVPYARALRQKDTVMLKKLRDAYLDFTMAATAFAEKITPQIFGRDIPQTLLIHTNDINADCLDEMLTALAKRGYQFITLDEAMKDAAYQTKVTGVYDRGPTWLWRWMQSKGMKVSFKDDPEPPRWVMELYQQN